MPTRFGPLSGHVVAAMPPNSKFPKHMSGSSPKPVPTSKAFRPRPRRNWRLQSLGTVLLIGKTKNLGR